MKSQVAFWCRNQYERLKYVFQHSRMHFYICFGCAMLGLLFALFGNYSGYAVSANFIQAVATGVSNPAGTAIWILFLTTLLFVSLFLGSIRFICFLLFGYGGIVIGTYLLWRAAFIALAVSSFYGLLYLLLFIIPLFFVVWFCAVLALNRLYELCGYSHNRRCTVRLFGHVRSVFLCLRKYYFFALAFNFCWWLFIYLIFVWIY